MAQQFYEGDVKQQFEAAIPILIILLLIVGVIALNPNLVSGIPILNDVFGSETIDVLIIGDAVTEQNDWKTHVSGDLAKQVFGNPLNVDIIMDNEYNKMNQPEWFDNQGYEIVVLTAQDLTPALQIVIKNWVQGGGKLLVVATGGIKENGRWAELEGIMPVECGAGGDCSAIMSAVYAPTFYIEDSSNALAGKLDTTTPLTASDASINVAGVTVKEGQIVYLGGFASADGVQSGGTGDIHPGIAEAGAVAGGKVVYISFNPTTENITPAVEENLVINLLAYTAGVEGYQSV